MTAERRTIVAASQHPFAVVLTCSDSRVAPEILFDQGLGDLFVVRVIGNVATDAVMGSIEYAVAHLGVALVMVVGHERCGAVEAAVNAVTRGDEAHGNIGALVTSIRPAVEQVRGMPGDLLDNAVKANVALVTGQLNRTPVFEALVRSGSLQIAGTRYDLDTGRAELIM